MPATVVDLRPDRYLLDHTFEGYKLNLQSLPHWSDTLSISVDKAYPDEVQYSFLYAKLFGLHNHLITDVWDYRYNFYYIDKSQKVRRISFENMTHTFQNTVVYDIPANIERKSGHFNVTLCFPTVNLAVLSDGTGYLHILNTGNRTSVNYCGWTNLYSEISLDSKYFVLIDCRTEDKDNKLTLHCLLQSVEQINEYFYTVLTWLTFENDETAWKKISIRELQGKGSIHYAAIETSFEAIYVASDNQFSYIKDTINEIKPPEVNLKPKKIIYTWLQTTDDVTITLKLPDGFDRNLFHVNITPLVVKISYAGSKFVEGKLKYKVDSELTTWNIQDNGQVDVLLTKSESKIWEELLDGGDLNGEQIMDASLVEEAHRRLAHLCAETEVSEEQSVPGFSTQQLEECDAASDEDTVLVRLDATTHASTHKIPLTVHQYIFHTNIDSQNVSALALRHDVDCCVWQPYPKLLNETWPMKHIGTLSAFGYIQSSKQNKKFVTSPPDFSYSVVCESTRHIFIYRASNNNLRHRSASGVKTVKTGHQFVFNIDKFGEVLGVCATNSYLFVLTETEIVSIEMT